METINYMSIDDQIEKLKAQHLTFFNIDAAKNQLKIFGYSNIIKSYRDPYVIASDGKKIFRSGTFLPEAWVKSNTARRVFQ